MGKKIIKTEQNMKDEYRNITELLEDMPNDLILMKRDVEVNNTQNNTVNNQMILIYRLSKAKDEHFADRCIAYLREEKTGIIRKLDMERLQEALAKEFVKALTPEKFMDDFVKTLTPFQLMDAFDRAIIKKGKIQEKEGCYKFHIYGKRGAPMEIMLSE